MIYRLFYLIPILIAVFFGYLIGGGKQPNNSSTSQCILQPNIDFPVTTTKPFAIVVYSYKQAQLCERIIKSIFEQDYERFRVIFFDDGSQDGTFERVQTFVLDNKQDHRVILIQNPERIGPVACLYRAAGTLLDEEIIIPMDAKDWLTHPKVLSRLNQAFQNSDVWLVLSGPLLYPSYEQYFFSLAKDRPFPTYVPASFYAGLFKQVRLADLLREGRFVTGRNAYLEPLIQMSGERLRILNEPLFMANLARCRREVQDTPLFTYAPLPDFIKKIDKETADIVLFSCDRPLQLFACLESIKQYLTGYDRISVICRFSDDQFGAGYQQVANQFPDVRFVYQGKDYKKDFKPLLTKTIFDSPSNYVLFGTDDAIVKDFADLTTCIEMIQKTNAYGFYLRLGSHITYSYQTAKSQTPPASVHLEKGIYAWNLKAGYSDWEFPNTLDMTLYRKSSLKQPFETMRYKTPNSLEFSWTKEVQPENEIGLYFEHSKMVNIPMNVVSQTGNPHMNYLSPKELLFKFEQGLKIDIQPLYRIDNPSPHMEYYPDFVVR